MILYEYCNNIICVESDEEHFSEKQMSISFIINEISQFKKIKNSKWPPFLNL